MRIIGVGNARQFTAPYIQKGGRVHYLPINGNLTHPAQIIPRLQTMNRLGLRYVADTIQHVSWN